MPEGPEVNWQTSGQTGLVWKVHEEGIQPVSDLDRRCTVGRVQQAVVALQDPVNDLDELPCFHGLQLVRMPDVLFAQTGMLGFGLWSWHDNTSIERLVKPAFSWMQSQPCPFFDSSYGNSGGPRVRREPSTI